MITNVGSQASGLVNKVLPKGNEKNQINKTKEVELKDKLSLLSEQIKNGDYKVDLDKTSQAILKELLG